MTLIGSASFYGIAISRGLTHHRVCLRRWFPGGRRRVEFPFVPRSSASATSEAPSWSPPTCLSTNGPKSSDRSVLPERLTGASHRSVAGPPHSPRPHLGDEWRELPAEAQPGEHRPSVGRAARLLSTSGPPIPAPEASPCRFPVRFFVTVLVEHFLSAAVVDVQRKRPR